MSIKNINKVFIFNPDHDLALANHDLNYMPPAAARQLATDLAILPLWYADNSAVLAISAHNLSFLQKMNKLFSSLPVLVTDNKLGKFPEIIPVPWGWNPSIRKRLLLLGMSADKMPSEQQLDRIRQKSHRLHAVNMLKELRSVNGTCGESFYYEKIYQIKSFVEGSQECILKAPISGSGKGLNWCKGIYTPHISNWCKNTIRRQGGVVAEPLYNKALDFAMQFNIDSSGSVKFTGYSVFHTKATGAYEGNVLGTDKNMELIITDYIPLETLSTIRKELQFKLSGNLQGIYTGYLGVDMMICKFGDEPVYRVHPCVEINLRMNMGMAARKIYDKYISPSAKGIFRVDYFNSPEELISHDSMMREKHPLLVRNNKVISGYLPLVPVTPASRYLAWILVD